MVERWTVVPFVGCSIHPDETSHVVQWLGYLVFTQAIWVQFPAWEGDGARARFYEDSMAEWLTRRPAKPVSFGGAGSNPAAVACTNGRVVKALRLGRNLFGGMGSNPISYKKC